jgi:hypothetical protein
MNSSTPIYKDPSRTVDERIADLLPRMSIEEKVAQMSVSASFLCSRRPTRSASEESLGYMPSTDPFPLTHPPPLHRLHTARRETSTSSSTTRIRLRSTTQPVSSAWPQLEPARSGVRRPLPYSPLSRC